MSNYSQYIGARDGKRMMLHSNGNTKDIVNAIISSDKPAAEYTKKLAPVLKGNTDIDTCYNLWKFWKENVQYKEDPDGYQFVKSPRELFHSGEGDCKSYSLAVASCLKNLNIPYSYRFISETKGKELHHVYIVAHTRSGNVIIDCVLHKFNYENPFEVKKDINPSATVAMPKIGANEQLITDIEVNWQEYVAAYKKNVQSQTFWVLNQIIADIRLKYKNKPLQRDLLTKEISKKFNQFLNTGSVLVYHYWPSEYGEFPIKLIDKKKYSDDFYQELSKLGVKDSTLRELCSIGVFNLYGIPLDYLLYRAKNLIKYGLPWVPKKGYPYWDAKNMQLVPNGAPFGLAIQILASFPYGGGISRPYGEPYWSRGGFIVPNGMKPEGPIFEKWLAQSKKPDTNAGNVVTPQGAANSIKQYELWRKGELPGLPTIFKAQIDVNGQIVTQNLGDSKPKIGDFGITATIVTTIITSVLAFVGSIIGAVMALLTEKEKSKVVPNYPQDFGESSYTSTDGCTVYLDNGVYNKVCPNGQIQNNIDPNNPVNQPAAGANAISESSSGMWIALVGIGLLALAYLLPSKKQTNG